MFLSKKHLSRRTLLKGAGASIALPLLDAMIPAATAMAQTPAATRLRGRRDAIPGLSSFSGSPSARRSSAIDTIGSPWEAVVVVCTGSNSAYEHSDSCAGPDCPRRRSSPYGTDLVNRATA